MFLNLGLTKFLWRQFAELYSNAYFMLQGKFAFFVFFRFLRPNQACDSGESVPCFMLVNSYDCPNETI
jgi:hypothetical protein